MNFQTPFLKHLAFPYFWSDLIENVHANSKSVEVVWYEVSRGYAALIEIYGLLKVVPFFGPPDICLSFPMDCYCFCHCLSYQTHSPIDAKSAHNLALHDNCRFVPFCHFL